MGVAVKHETRAVVGLEEFAGRGRLGRAG
jgi:hypothetical protein